MFLFYRYNIPSGTFFFFFNVVYLFFKQRIYTLVKILFLRSLTINNISRVENTRTVHSSCDIYKPNLGAAIDLIEAFVISLLISLLQFVIFENKAYLSSLLARILLIFIIVIIFIYFYHSKIPGLHFNLTNDCFQINLAILYLFIPDPN